jgi:hypothetical protein
VVLLFRWRSQARYWYSAFLLAGLATVLVTYPNPRFLLPFTSILIVPAALAMTRVWDGCRARVRSRACVPPPPGQMLELR